MGMVHFCEIAELDDFVKLIRDKKCERREFCCKKKSSIDDACRRKGRVIVEELCRIMSSFLVG